MKDILPGAVLIEVRIGLNRKDSPFKGMYYCELVFEQDIRGQTEFVSDIYSMQNPRLIEKIAALENIGKVIENHTKSFYENGHFVTYNFTDQSTMFIYS